MKIKVTHCSNCPCGEGWYKKTGFSGYFCNAEPDNPKCVIYTDKDPDEKQPDECPLKTGDIVIARG